MALTKRQIKAIEKLIEDRMLRFTLENIGSEALTPSEITQPHFANSNYF